MNEEIYGLIMSLADGDGDVCTYDLKHTEGFEMIESGDWVNEGKYEFSESILRHNPTETYWSVSRNRSGSYYSDYYYGESSVSQVEPKEEVITIIKWVSVK